jgi:hypothetical protein
VRGVEGTTEGGVDEIAALIGISLLDLVLTGNLGTGTRAPVSALTRTYVHSSLERSDVTR